jgi:hypothetical protein
MLEQRQLLELQEQQRQLLELQEQQRQLLELLEQLQEQQLQGLLLEQLELLLFWSKQPGQQPAGRRSAGIFSFKFSFITSTRIKQCCDE